MQSIGLTDLANELDNAVVRFTCRRKRIHSLKYYYERARLERYPLEEGASYQQGGL